MLVPSAKMATSNGAAVDPAMTPVAAITAHQARGLCWDGRSLGLLQIFIATWLVVRLQIVVNYLPRLKHAVAVGMVTDTIS